MIGDCGSQQSDAIGPLHTASDLIEQRFQGAVAGRPEDVAGDAETTAPATAASCLDQGHLLELGLVGENE